MAIESNGQLRVSNLSLEAAGGHITNLDSDMASSLQVHVRISLTTSCVCEKGTMSTVDQWMTIKE